jgi:ComF family protein
MKYLVRDLWHLFYPPICISCRQRLIDGEEVFCIKCLHSIPEFDSFMEAEHPTYLQLKGLTPYRNIVAVYRYSITSLLKPAFKALKYDDRPSVGTVLGRSLGRYLNCHEQYKKCDLVVPVPLHEKKLRKRGYNQASVICDAVGRILGIPVRTDILERKDSGLTQTRKNKWQRQTILADSYHVSPKVSQYRSVLIIDDIITTGATINACGEAFKDYPDTDLYAASVAFTQK